MLKGWFCSSSIDCNVKIQIYIILREKSVRALEYLIKWARRCDKWEPVDFKRVLQLHILALFYTCRVMR